MFAKLFKIAAAAAVVATVSATPLPSGKSLAARGSHSFNSYMGFSDMSGFDNFYGSDNFSGVISKTVVEHESELVCHSESVEIVQQRLLVLQEMAKRIITEQICEVESQTVVFEQFYSSMGHFSGDIRHKSHRGAGYDEGIASHYGSIVEGDGSLSSNDLGFSGQDLGSHWVVPSGSNWNDGSSPSSVESAFEAAKAARSS
ncbi:hypothetical protein D9619_007124 [Psilocybe cf. subviscida]|uniref:Uncharacterized protein n=1 Tax=Psilocybe cf. subviscida TaxID=2480587 RepID=A0A8H5EWV7_9AGAR|nr:hypothetical protein D9619_007124 [Psilocybe cf. subviscida]